MASKMYCTWCREDAVTPKEKRYALVRGSDLLKGDKVNFHEGTKLHRRAKTKLAEPVEVKDTGRLCVTVAKERFL